MALDYTKYSGNNDFRGFLAANGLSEYLAYTGNDGKVNDTALKKSLYGTGKVLGDTATDIRFVQSANNNDANYSKYEYTPMIISGLYDSWSKAQQGASANAGGGSGGSGGSGGGVVSQPGLTAAQRATIDNQWGQNNQYYNDLLGSVDPRKAAAQQGIDRQVSTSTAALGSERDAAYQNLDRQDTKLEKGYAQGRQSLGEQIRNTLQGQSNNIGMLGGGNSSAIQMLGVGVADVQNQEQGKMLDDLNEQKTDIEINRQQVKQKLDDELRKLNDFKISKYQEIQDQFNSERNEILNKLNANDNQRAQALASAGAAATQYIQAVDATIKNRLNQIADTYKNIQGPAVSLASVPAYEATNIAGPNVSLQDQPQTQLTPDQATQSVVPRRTDDDTLLYVAPRKDTTDQPLY